MKEDASQVRSGSAPQVMAALRHYRYKPLEALALLGIPAPLRTERPWVALVAIRRKLLL